MQVHQPGPLPLVITWVELVRFLGALPATIAQFTTLRVEAGQSQLLERSTAVAQSAGSLLAALLKVSCITILGTIFLSACTTSATENRADLVGSAYLGQVAKSWAEHYGISDPPKVQPIRFIASEEVDTIHKECLINAGYKQNDMNSINVPEGQEKTFALAEYTCRMQYPISEKYTQKWGKNEILTQYAWTRDFVIPCLNNADYPVAGLSSESVFVETWESKPFYPFEQVVLDVPAEKYNAAWASLEEKCRQIVPDAVLWEGVSIAEWSAGHG